MAGAYKGGLQVESVSSGFNVPVNPFGTGSASVGYTVANVGNVRLTGTAHVTVTGPFGMKSIVEPLKLLAVALAGEGHWMTGTAMIVATYATSLVLVERLFVIVKPKLLKLRWFARLWCRLTILRYRLTACFRQAKPVA